MINKLSKLGVISIVCIAILGFIAVISLSAKMSATCKVVTAKKNIAMGTIINKDNISELFELSEAKAEEKEDCYSYLEDLNGAVITCDLYEGDVLTDTKIKSDFKPITGIKTPVVMGLRATDVSQFVSGIIRRGDTVNISFIDELSGKCNTVLQNVYVCGSYNDDGTLIEDEEGRAMSINILVDKENENMINEYLSKGQIRISKTGGGLNEWT